MGAPASSDKHDKINLASEPQVPGRRACTRKVGSLGGARKEEEINNSLGFREASRLRFYFGGNQETVCSNQNYLTSLLQILGTNLGILFPLF